MLLIDVIFDKEYVELIYSIDKNAKSLVNTVATDKFIKQPFLDIIHNYSEDDIVKIVQSYKEFLRNKNK